MPPPDERPRQSVANLIGRFEQQVKRQASPAPPVVPRSSSVSSQITGDAAKQEAKEKREWPPKSVASTDNKPIASTLPNPPSPTMPKSPAVSPQPIPVPDAAPSPPSAAPSPSPPPPPPPPPPPLPPANVVTTPTPTPASPEPARSPPSKTKAVPTGKSTPSAGARRPVISPAKSRSAVPNNAPGKSQVTFPPPKTSLQSSASQPIKPQHTGQSVTSNSGTARPVRTTPKTAPSTPSRPRLSNPQTQHIIRPKTPSSGLFAPTAASLARSRNALPPPPPPVRKMTLSNDAAERLSKPTAASLSRARTPAPPAQTPARVVKSTSSSATHGATPRGTPKPQVGRAPVKMKEAAVKQAVKSSAASASSEPSRDSDHPVDDHPENGHGSGAPAFSDGGSQDDTHGHSEVMGDVTHDPAAALELREPHEELLSESEVHRVNEQPVGEQLTEEPAPVDEHVDQGGPEEGVTRDGVHLEVQQDSVSEPTESHADEVISNGDGLKVEVTASPAGNDIEDIVNLLEGSSLSKARPQSIVSIPDEEILDEY